MRVRFRSWPGNIACASVPALLVALVTTPYLVDPPPTDAPRFWLVPCGTACGMVIVVRCLRREVVVDDDGITRRAAFATWFVSWSSIKSLVFDGPSTCVVRRFGGGEPISLSVSSAPQHTTLEAACSVWTPEARKVRVDPLRYPRDGRGALRLALIGAIITSFVGLGLWLKATEDRDEYADRAARERHTVAVITRVWVEAGEGSSGDKDPTTFVAARVQLDDDRVIEIEVHRDRDVASRYDVEDGVPIVYDAAHPRDADFADRPTRQAQDHSVDLHLVTGPLAFFVGLAVAFAVGGVMAHDWRRRLG